MKRLHVSTAAAAAVVCLLTGLPVQAEPVSPDPTILVNGKPFDFGQAGTQQPAAEAVQEPTILVDGQAVDMEALEQTSLDEPSDGQAAAPVSVDDFGLDTVVTLIENKQVSDAAHLEEVINADDSGINNIDFDGDGLVDPVIVREIHEDGAFTFKLIAVASSDPEASLQMPIALITFLEGENARQIEIVASFV